MKAILFTEVGKYQIKNIDIPVINEEEVLINNKYGLIFRKAFLSLGHFL